MLDPYGHNRTPAENPNRNSVGAQGFAQGNYTPPTYGQDIAAAGVQRQPLQSLLTMAEPQPEVNGVGGPLSPARDIIPNAPQGPNQYELEAAAAREAIRRAQANPGSGPLNYNENQQWYGQRQQLDRLQDRARADQAEMARREGVSFEDWWRFGGRQSSDWTPEQPAYRLTQLPRGTGQTLGGMVGARGAPIDMNRPIINNGDGSISTERTITVEADGRQYLIPTIVGGRQRSEDEAVQLWRSGQNPEVGVYGSAGEAERAAQARSRRIGRERGLWATSRRR